MKHSPIIELLTRAEVFFWLAALVASVSARVTRGFSALPVLLFVRALGTAWYEWLTLAYPAGAQATSSYVHAYFLFYKVYWALYFIATVATFFCIEQLLRSAFEPLPGLARLAVFVFRYTGGLCLFIALTAHLPTVGRVPVQIWFEALAVSFALCTGIFEIALVSILMINARRLGLSLRTRVLGLSIGFLFFGMADIPAVIATALRAPHPWLYLSSEIGLLLAVTIWTGYLLFPDGRRGPLALKPNSTLMRWNEIVNQIGGAGTGMPVPAASFMSEVETLVERIMIRNADRGL